ncbi:MAG: limonene,2-epoxide hydrolase [Actinomycetia bacterium]|nr:limonene,2-epoxide hydrolase [Actinomycetes bacterium]
MSPGAAERDAEAVVLAFCAAAGACDAEQLRPFFSDDVVYHNVPMAPAKGIDATMEAITGMFAMFETVEFEITNIAANGNVVLTERIDRVTLGEVVAPMPVMGAFEVADGRIIAWRDYFDLNQIGQMLAGGPAA